MSYQDRQLTCVECGRPFIDSADDQAYRAQRGFSNDPRRCPDCRQARRAASGGGSYGSGGSSGDAGSYGGGRPMFEVTCASCGRPAQVPFQPRGDRPVYCNDCFRGQSGSAGDRRRSRGGYDGGRSSRGRGRY